MTRNLKIQPNFSNNTEVKNAADVKQLELRVGSTHIVAGLGETFPNLEDVMITYQTIKFIEREDFADMPHLTGLRLFENKIEFLPENVFYDLPNLKKLFLSDNRIKKLPEKIFKNLQKIDFVNIENNRIEHLSKNLFINNVEIENIQASGNPFKIIDVDFTKLTQLWRLGLQPGNCVNFWAVGKVKIPEVQQLVNSNCTLLAEKKNRKRN